MRKNVVAERGAPQRDCPLTAAPSKRETTLDSRGTDFRWLWVCMYIGILKRRNITSNCYEILLPHTVKKFVWWS